MGVQTEFLVIHSCGHEQDHDLSDRRSSERAGFARWLAKKECSDCWRDSRDRDNGKEREAWLAARRAAEDDEIEIWEREADMPPLEGSDKQVQWARRVRRDLLGAGHDWWLEQGQDDDAFGAEVETPARTILRAHWWIDQRDSTPEDLLELVADAAAGLDGSENPY